MTDLTFSGFDLRVEPEFHGFENSCIMASFLRSSLFWNFLEENNYTFSGVKTCYSFSVSSGEHRNTFIFKVIPLPKKRVRVLSLFDGISTALHILKEVLNLDVEIYFSSEIDEDALHVQRELYYNQLIALGSVKLIEPELCDALGEINLLIGGIPCNELSRVNPRRKGICDQSSTGPLFFDYVRIRNILAAKAEMKQQPFLWLFENTKHMDKATERIISRVLNVSPVTCCSTSFLPAHRERNFWGNIPGLVDRAKERKTFTPKKLSEILGPHKHTSVDMLPTLTTNVSSQRIGPGKSWPLIENGRDTPLSTTDKEAIFGFPRHYTDVARLTPSRREKLLGRSWCVPVVSYLLSPLAEMFQSRNLSLSLTNNKNPPTPPLEK